MEEKEKNILNISAIKIGNNLESTEQERKKKIEMNNPDNADFKGEIVILA